MVHVLNANGEIKTDEHVTLDDESVTAAKIANRTRKFFVPCVGGWNTQDGVVLVSNSPSGLQGFELLDLKTSHCYGRFLVPQNFVSGMTITAIVNTVNSGNIESMNSAYYGACGEIYTTHNIVVGPAAVAIVNTAQNCIQALTPAAEAVDDIMNLEYRRDGNAVNDSLAGIAYFPGWIVEYTADS